MLKMLEYFTSLTLTPMLLLLLLVFPILLLYKCFIIITNPTNQNSPPSPPKLPFIGNLHQLGPYPYRSLEALAKRYAHDDDDLMLLHFGNVPILVVSSPETAREVLHTNGLVFSSRPKLIAFEKLLYNSRDVSSAPYGDYWRQMKTVFVSHLLSAKRVQSYREIREEETRLMMRKIKEAEKGVVNVTEMLSGFTIDVSCMVAFGRKYCVGEDGERFQKLLKEFLELLGRVNIADYVPWLAWWSRLTGLNGKLDEVAKRFDDFLEGVVQERIDSNYASEDLKRNNVGEDGDEDKKAFVDVLLGLQKENKDGFALDRLSMKGLILDVFTAGNDTHAIIDWAMSELLRHPTAMQKLQNEVRKFATTKSMVTEDDIVSMPYLKAVIKETFRLYPTIPLLPPKLLTQDIKINGYDIKLGTQALVNIWKINRDPKSFENPEKFEPERFMGSGIDFKGNDFQLLPFGSGRRMCPAVQYATAIIELAIANLVFKFDWEVANGVEGEELDMVGATGLNLRRENPLKAIPILYTHNH